MQVRWRGGKEDANNKKKKKTREEEGEEIVDASVRHDVTRWSDEALARSQVFDTRLSAQSRQERASCRRREEEEEEEK